MPTYGPILHVLIISLTCQFCVLQAPTSGKILSSPLRLRVGTWVHDACCPLQFFTTAYSYFNRTKRSIPIKEETISLLPLIVRPLHDAVITAEKFTIPIERRIYTSISSGTFVLLDEPAFGVLQKLFKNNSWEQTSSFSTEQLVTNRVKYRSIAAQKDDRPYPKIVEQLSFELRHGSRNHRIILPVELQQIKLHFDKLEPLQLWSLPAQVPASARIVQGCITEQHLNLRSIPDEHSEQITLLLREQPSHGNLYLLKNNSKEYLGIGSSFSQVSALFD
ncbi:hypothetical protein Ciccas_009817 [Cichlidogyrus casuarinus]|uniref:Uncharacterized protein n=1 Tax=Cichlidogyrus casuarinus TaxID=1844966 RepID=A0ABD2PVX7_9PLAT